MEILKSLLYYNIFGLLRPYKANYIQQMLDFQQKSSEAHQERDWRTIISFHVISLLLFSIGCYCLFLFLKDFDEIETLVFCDILHMFRVEKKLYFIFILHCFVAIYYYELFYNNMNSQIRWYVQMILGGKNREVFHCNFKYKNQLAIITVQKQVKSFPKALSVFAYGLGKLCLRIKPNYPLLQFSLVLDFTLFCFKNISISFKDRKSAFCIRSIRNWYF